MAIYEHDVHLTPDPGHSVPPGRRDPWPASPDPLAGEEQGSSRLANILGLPPGDVLTGPTMPQPSAPSGVLPWVLAGMTTLVATLIECRARVAAMTEAGTTGPAPAMQDTAASAATECQPACDLCADVRADLLAALSDAQRQGCGRGVRVEVAAPPGLALGVPTATLRPVLVALLSSAIEHASSDDAPGGRVFIGAMRADREVRIVIIDDGRRASAPLTTEAHASLARLLAVADASLLVDDRPGDGTTMMLCLPDTE